MNKKSHHKYLTHNIAKTYRKVNRSKVNRIDFKAKKIFKKSAIHDRHCTKNKVLHYGFFQ